MDSIRLRYEAIDGYRITRTFKTQEGARKFVTKWVGKMYDISTTFQYAVSADGIGKVTVLDGARIEQLVP